jgi:hypothetical protein
VPLSNTQLRPSFFPCFISHSAWLDSRWLTGHLRRANPVNAMQQGVLSGS